MVKKSITGTVPASEYLVLFAGSNEELCSLVEKRISLGYKPCGGVSVTYCPYPNKHLLFAGLLYAQAMEKKTNISA